MKIIPIAFDSFGARSMATFVKTKDVGIIIDPSVALGPRRYGLPPHKIEYERKELLWKEIKSFVKRSDIAVISHYHYDHHNPNEVEIFEGKKLFIKHPTRNINFSQKKRASYFIQQLRNSEVTIADNSTHEIGDTKVIFSDAIPHGTNTKLGYVIMTCVIESKVFVHTSDVEGLSLNEQLEWLLKFNPEIVFADGAMTYMLGYRYSYKSLQSSIENLKTVIEKTDVKKLILDHHLTRDLMWRERIAELFEFGESMGVKVISAAEFCGRKEELLEAMRKELYSKNLSGLAGI